MLTRNRLNSHSYSDVTDQGSFKNAVISVGKDYQSKLPSLMKTASKDYYATKKRKYEVMLWSPKFVKVTDDKLQELITSSRINYNYSEEMILGLIKWHKGELESVSGDLTNFVPKKDYWTADDRIKFFMALDFHNKNFTVVKDLFPNKTVGQLVVAYYLFKKNINIVRLFSGPPLNAGSAIMGQSVLSKAKKFDTVFPKHFISKFGSMIRSLPQFTSVSASANFTNHIWGDHAMAELVKGLMRQAEALQNRHCYSRLQEQGSELVLDHIVTSASKGGQKRGCKRSHQCVCDHRRWLQEFYQSYSHQELIQFLQTTNQEMRAGPFLAVDQEIADMESLISPLETEIMDKSKALIDELKNLKFRMPRFNSRWVESDIQLAQLAIREAGGDIKFVAAALGDKSINMVKHFISLYSQRLQIDEEIWRNLMSNSSGTVTKQP